ncbi:FmdB family zinc ribbon protein [Maridesulfovibrio ferrireducens]|uniref:Putative regulatory protein, FmdB family n=1 Tax=Maridesulfovibrio ferrireducens TaxID=246191 RepID=A0A1G9HDQ3_9BACT|nr:FmdB family zinc ribbon protein [Maridesulfovibrio ferrireducens]MBI9110551.1 zinc ribbon domain-containing protein [Maridesulfovibrio ferrireducens]SDL11029.1 putative regulatory protein, FmdB family [Maridesulfovibrio ferrireducens]
MPIFEYICLECGKIYEEISSSDANEGECPSCGKTTREKLISSTSTLTGKEAPVTKPHGGKGCCGSSPSAKGCIPGSCCGRT